MAQAPGSDRAAARLIERVLADPEFRARYRQDPVAAAREAGLDPSAATAAQPALETLELRESKSSLAGSLMAVAVEGLALYELVGQGGGGGLGAEAAEAAMQSTPRAVSALLDNPNVQLDASGVADLRAGRIDPRIVAVLEGVSRHHRIAISAMMSDHDVNTAGGSVSNHHYGRAVDIAVVDGQPVSPGNAAARKLAESLLRLDPSVRPTELGSPWQLASSAAFTDGDHQDHVHVAYDDPVPPGWKPPAPAPGEAPTDREDSSAAPDDPSDPDDSSADPDDSSIDPDDSSGSDSSDSDSDDSSADPDDSSDSDSDSSDDEDDAAEEDDEEDDDEDEEEDGDEEEDSNEDDEDEDEDEPDEDEPDEDEPDEEEPDEVGPDQDDLTDDEREDAPDEPDEPAQDAPDAPDDEPDDVPEADLGDAPTDYPGDAAPKEQVAAWMAAEAKRRGLPAELPVMAALVESGMRNLPGGDADSMGFFQMRTSIWNQGPYAGYGANPQLQLKWFLDHAEQLPKRGPGQYGDWIADVERPAEQYRGRYQLRLEEARELLGGFEPRPAAPDANQAQVLPVIRADQVVRRHR